MSGPYRERHYRAEEVRAIVARALAGRPDPTRGAEGLSQSELDRLLSSLLVPAAERSAVLDDASKPSPDATVETSLGLPKRAVLERTIDGELDEDAREDCVEAIRASFKDPGRIAVLGRSVTWTSTPTSMDSHRKVSVSVRSRDGRTRFRIEENLQSFHVGAGVGYGLAAILTLIAVLSSVNHGAAAMIVLTLMIATVLVTWFATRAAVAARRGNLQRLLDDLVDVAAVRRVSVTTRIAAPPPEAEEEVSVMLDEADGDADRGAPLRRREARR